MSDRNALKEAAEAAIAARLVNDQTDQIEHANNVFEGMARPAVVLDLILQIERREDGPSCWTCGDMGHVHRIDGEYLGVCDQCNVYELSCVKHELAQAKQVIAEHVEPVSVNTMQRREQWLQNIADAIKFGLPGQLRERLQYTDKQIRSSMRYGGTRRLRDEVARLTAQVELLTAERDARVRQVRNALNESEELRQDAERHRYWRLHTESFHLTGPVSEEAANRNDAFIDAAMRKELQP